MHPAERAKKFLDKGKEKVIKTINVIWECVCEKITPDWQKFEESFLSWEGSTCIIYWILFETQSQICMSEKKRKKIFNCSVEIFFSTTMFIPQKKLIPLP